MHAALFYSSTKKGALDSQPQVEKVCQLLALGRWFSPGTPASSTTKTGRHDIAEILLKVALKHQKSNQIYSSNETNSGIIHICCPYIHVVPIPLNV